MFQKLCFKPNLQPQSRIFEVLNTEYVKRECVHKNFNQRNYVIEHFYTANEF